MDGFCRRVRLGLTIDRYDTQTLPSSTQEKLREVQKVVWILVEAGERRAFELRREGLGSRSSEVATRESEALHS